VSGIQQGVLEVDDSANRPVCDALERFIPVTTQIASADSVVTTRPDAGVRAAATRAPMPQRAAV
jgi:hypothetical protein